MGNTKNDLDTIRQIARGLSQGGIIGKEHHKLVQETLKGIGKLLADPSKGDTLMKRMANLPEEKRLLVNALHASPIVQINLNFKL